MPQKFFNRIAPLAALSLGVAVAGCDMDIQINGEEGVPLAELDMSGDPPREVALLGPDNVVITEGDSLTIDVEGNSEAVDAMRFTLEGGTLGILRDSDSWDGNEKATVRVTMPAPRELSMAGSGTIDSATMDSDAEIGAAGAGRIKVAAIDAESLEISIAGSGDVEVVGETDSLEVSIAGSGDVESPDLKADRAEVSIAGSGNVAFASDGTVEANIMGSGDVVVTGDATCELNSMGSGTLRCNAAASDTAE